MTVSVLLLVMFIGECWHDIEFAKKEIAGTQYLAEIWPSYEAAGSGLRGADDAGAALQGARQTYDAKFGTAQASDAFSGASQLLSASP